MLEKFKLNRDDGYILRLLVQGIPLLGSHTELMIADFLERSVPAN
jgi:hypothetical protein